MVEVSKSIFFQKNGLFSILKHQTSLEGSLLIVPPITKIKGFKKTIWWPYLGDGLSPPTGTQTHLPLASFGLNFKRYNSLSTKLPWECAPPYITN